jgi:hypothetical protein
MATKPNIPPPPPGFEMIPPPPPGFEMVSEQAASPTAPEAGQPTKREGFWANLGGDLWDAAKGIGQLVGPPDTKGEKAAMILGPAGPILLRAGSGYYESVKKSLEDADAAAAKGDTAGVVFNSAAAGLPVVGPAVAGVYEKAQSGDTAGAVGMGVSRALQLTPVVPKAAQTLVRGAQKLKAGAQRSALLGRTPQEAYQSALKPSTGLTEAERTRVVDTGLVNEIPVTAKGLEKLHALLGDANTKIEAVIAADPTRAVNPAAAVQNLRGVRQKFADQVNPRADLKAINASGQEFIDQFRSRKGGAVRNIPAEQAQRIKRGTYRALGDKAYGELKGAQIEAQKALARGLKEELARQFPELNDLNKWDSRLLDLEPQLNRAVGRIGNQQGIGIGTPVVAAGVQAVTGSGKIGAVAAALKSILDQPGMKSKLAIAVSKGGRIPPALAIQRVNAYVAALGAVAVSAQSQREASRSEPESPESPGAFPGQ